MKSEHRHQLETNWLAKRLDRAIHRFRPYASTVLGIVVAVVLVMIVWSYVAGSSSARQGEAWNAFNEAVIEQQPDVDRLRVVAEEHPGTAMQQMADVTWADSQVLLAAENYLYNRPAATEALEKATSRYQSVIETADDDRLLNRAQLGLARIHEIRGELEKAREEYLKVKGGYEEYAKAQAQRLATPESKETYAWLATAKPPRPQSPIGPGTPGKQPEFSAGELALPGETATDGGVPAGAPGDAESFDKLLEGLKLDFDEIDETNDRYQPGGAPTPQPESPPAEGDAPPPQGDAPPAEEPDSTDTSSDSQTSGANADADQPKQ